MGKKPKSQEEFHLNEDVTTEPKPVNSGRFTAISVPQADPHFLSDEYQQKLMDYYMRTDSPVSNMMRSSPTFSAPPDLGHQQSDSNEAWAKLARELDPMGLCRELKEIMESEDYMIDGGVRYAMVPSSSLEVITKVLEVLDRHGAPDQQRKRLSYQEVADLLQNANRAMTQNALRNMPDEYRRLIPPNQEPLAGGAILIALSILRMLP